MDNLIIALNKPNDYESINIGGKAQSLIRLTDAEFNVPYGFVVTSKMQRVVFDRHNMADIVSRETEAMMSDDIAVSSNAAKHVRDAIMSIEFTNSELQLIKNAMCQHNFVDSYAVRSSGGLEDGNVDSWAGQFDSFLNVRRDDVPMYIKHCWASIFGLRAIKYGSVTLFGDDYPAFSVIVQEMINGDYSGIAFSVDPVDGNKSHIRIEAVEGTGEKVVGGQETPYSVVLGREDGLVLKRIFGRDKIELIAPSVLQELMYEVLRIEALFGMPIDVEWTILDSDIFILQARPITATKKVKEENNSDNLPDILDYQLTFKVNGLGFMFADLLCHGFGYLNPLFICDKGEFLQYFTNERMEYAARYGHRWLSTVGGFEEYKDEFIRFNERTFNLLEMTIDSDLDSTRVAQFFEEVYQYFTRYSKMDFQFTNLTYLYAAENKVISESLKSISEFKDIARVWINSVSIDDNCLLSRLLIKLSSMHNVELNDLEFYKISELLELFDGISVSQIEIDLRKNAAVAVCDGQSIRYFFGDSANIFINRVRAIQDSQNSADIIGQVANRGVDRLITGVVRMINVDYGNLEQMEIEMSKMNQGEILVSEFTSPELMVACKKAKAIITDLGGMLSHAAIVSRELGIPCVVGTEHASRSLKTGEEISVDLDLGTIGRSIP
jgi:phosphohistidine swiveling domain-containing protein